MTRSMWKVGAIVLAVTAVSVGAWQVTAASTPKAGASIAATSSAAATPALAPTTNSVPAQGFADVVAKVTPAVVTIRTERKAPVQLTQLPEGFPFDLFGQGMPRGRQMPAPNERALGSGVIVNDQGYILTNNHVVDQATSIQVELADKRVLDAKLIGADPPSDLAVVKIDAKDLSVLPIGDSNAMRVGDLVLAVGNPLGVGQTVTMGIVSAKGRATGLGDGSYEDFLQTDAPINQGNSGGALVNTKGELVGINSQILSPSGGNIGIGFAVPSNMAKNVMDQLVSVGEVHRGKLGVTVQSITGDLASGLGLNDAKGALVSDVTDGGAADKAGFERGDVILSVNGKTVTDSNQLRNEVAGTKPGSTVDVSVMRDGKTMTLRPTLEEMTVARSASGEPGEGEGGSGRFGMSVQPVTPDVARRMELPKDARGLVIVDVDPSGRAAAAGLREGDVIEQVNGRSVKNVDDLRSTLDAANDKPAVLLVDRQGTTIFVPLRAPRG